MQKNLLDSGNEKDYFAIESVLKGNYLIKDGWRKDAYSEYNINGAVATKSTPSGSIRDKNLQL